MDENSMIGMTWTVIISLILAGAVVGVVAVLWVMWPLLALAVEAIQVVAGVSRELGKHERHDG